MTAIAILNKQLIIDGLSKGKRIDDLGLNVSRQAVSKALKDDPDYQAAIIEYHASRLDRAEDLIEAAADNVDVARARALHTAYAWRAGVEQARIWGNKQEITQTNYNVDIAALLDQREKRVADAARVIDQEG
jgi:hypothetical protein